MMSLLFSACHSDDNGNAKRLDRTTPPPKAPQERTESLDERQTEWSQSTYAERPPSDSLAAEMADSSRIKE